MAEHNLTPEMQALIRKCAAATLLYEAKLKEFEAALMLGSPTLVERLRSSVVGAVEGILDAKEEVYREMHR